MWMVFDIHRSSKKPLEPLIQQQQRCPVKRHMAPAALQESIRWSLCVCAPIIQAAVHKKDLHELILYHLACLYAPHMWSHLKAFDETHFSVYTADPNKRKPPDEMLLCVCFCLVLEDHIASEDSVALGNNICLVSVGQVPSEQKCHLTRHEGFESMSAQCGELHHSNESLQRAYGDGLFLGLLVCSPNGGVTRNTVLLILLLCQTAPNGLAVLAQTTACTKKIKNWKTQLVKLIIGFVCSNNFQ